MQTQANPSVGSSACSPQACVPESSLPETGVATKELTLSVEEAELGWVWLNKQAELARIEAQAASLQFAILVARKGDIEALQVWVAKHGLPWLDEAATVISTAARLSTIDTDLSDIAPPKAPAKFAVAIEPPSAEKPWGNLASKAKTALASRGYATEQHATQQAVHSQPLKTDAPKSLKQDLPKTLKPEVRNSPAQSAPKLETPKREVKAVVSQPKPVVAQPVIAQPVIAQPVIARAETKVPREKQAIRKLPAWLVSGVFHALVVLLLMVFVVEIPAVKQSVSISSSIAQSEPVSLESPQQENAQQTEAEPIESLKELESNAEASLSKTDLLSGFEIPAANSLMSAGVLSGGSVGAGDGVPNLVSSLSGGGEGTSGVSLPLVEFFGVKGEGNVFCYVVDSSGSMRGGAFEAAKFELVRSIRSLKPNQRFFVLFFNQNVEKLKLELDGEPEKFMVQATPENIDRMVRWIDSVGIGPGAPPNEALEFAIELDPDAIFLLSDGVTGSDVAGRLRKINRLEDPITGGFVRCNIHTIGFYSTEGEALLKQIAQENQGVYRHVPPPAKLNKR